MKISLAMILDTLSIPYVNYIVEKQIYFKQVKLLSELTDTSDPNILYIGTQDQLNYCCLLKCRPYTLCIPDKLPLDEPECIREHTVYFTELIPLQELYFRVNACFDKLNAWDFRLNNSTLNKEGFQALLDASHGIFKNHIHIVEPFSKLLAFTKDIDIDEVDLNAMYTENMDKPESIRESQDMIYGHLKSSKNDIVLMDHNSVYIHPSVTKAVSEDGSFTVYVIMICKYRAFTDGVRELFLHLCNYIKHYTRKYDTMKKTYISHDIFFHGALNHIFSTNALNIHATLTLKLPLIANFNLYNITFTEPCENSYDQLMQLLYEKLPHSRLSRFHDSILLLNHYEQKDIRREHLSNLRKIHKDICAFQCAVGISHPFKNLQNITHAYNQTAAALSFYSRNKMPSFPVVPAYTGEPFFHYDDFSLSHTLLEICKCDPEMTSLAPYIDDIIGIQAYDQRKHTKCLPLFFAYLSLERNPAMAGKQIGISEENARYYIHKIEAMVHADLDSWRVRVKLLLAFEYLNLTPETLLSDKI